MVPRKEDGWRCAEFYGVTHYIPGDMIRFLKSVRRHIHGRYLERIFRHYSRGV